LKRPTLISCLRQPKYKRRRLYDTSQELHSPSYIIRRNILEPHQHVLIIDTGGGVHPTITSNAWKITHRYNVTMSMSGYQSKDPPQECPVVNAVTKVEIPGRLDPVLFEVNYATLINDADEFESLVVPFEMMKHGIKVDMIPPKYGGTGAIVVDEERLPFLFDEEKLYWKISTPTRDDLDTLKWIEINPPALLGERLRRRKKVELSSSIPWKEWRKRLAMLPEDVVKRTVLDATTQVYMNVENENRGEPREHYQSICPGLRNFRQNETVASDTYFPTKVTNQGHTCSQIFIGLDSDFWVTYPLKRESSNGEALQDYTRTYGCPNIIKTDNAQSELGAVWTKHCRTHAIGSEFTEPHHPWQNPAEKRIGSLSVMVKTVMREFNVPLSRHHWVQKWCCDVHNIAANRKLDWRSPKERKTGHTPDISMFRFHVWEPIWYYEPHTKQPENSLKRARWLGFAHTSGDAMTYFIETERDGTDDRRRNVILVRSIIRTRRKNIGTLDEYVNNEPTLVDFFLSHQELETNKNDMLVDEATSENMDADPSDLDKSLPAISEQKEDLGEEQEPKENLPPGEADNDPPMTPDELETLYDQFQMEDDINYKFDRILDYEFKEGVLILKAKYLDDDIGEHNLAVPFPILKRDVPVELARFIRDKVIEDKRGGYYNTWAKNTLKAHSRGVRRLYHTYKIDSMYRIFRTRRAKANRMSKNARTEQETKDTNRIKMGIKVPRNTKEALLFDRQNKNNLWAEAITKEMAGLERLNVFKFHSPNHKCDKNEGWQFAPMHMIFDIKQQDMRYKARLVVGGHVIDSTRYNTYSSVVENLSVRLVFLVASHQGLSIMTGDIGNAFPTAPCAEKVWSVCGPEFGVKEGAIVTLQRALFGLKTASRSFHEFFGDTLRRMGFTPTRADQDLWYRKADDHNGYDYIATHVDDIAIAAKRPAEYMNQIEQEFLVRNKEDSPSYYLGNDLKMHGTKLHVSNKTYVKETIRKYQEEYRCLSKKNIPMSPQAHPELDASDLLDDKDIRQYQRIVGVLQWLVVAGRFDINFATSSLSRYAAAPRKGHLDLAEDVLGYPMPPKTDDRYKTMKVKEDFGCQYQYFQEELDPRFPTPLIPEMDITLFIDANHAHDKITGRSITGLFGLVGCTPVLWSSKRQASVQTSTFGAEFTALKKAVEEAIKLRYYLRSMGILVTKPTPVYVDNMSVVLNASNPGSSLNKKSVALSYHFVREHVANNVIEIRKIDSVDNYADPFTKALASTGHCDFFHEVMCN